MSNLSGSTCLLRAVEPHDLELMYRWENDPAVWHVSGTLAPFSRHLLEGFIESQRQDIFQSRQQRLIIETRAQGEAVGAIDLFEIDPLNRRAGIGILIYGAQNRRKGYASEALHLTLKYARNVLGLEQLWCNVEAGNRGSLRLFRALGFQKAGLKRHWNWSPQGWLDEYFLQRLLND